jgi:adenylate cyclase class 2
MVSNGIETEVKIPLPTADGLPGRLRDAGFSVSVPREFESNTLYDTKDQRLRRSGMILRLRQIGEKNIITWKGPSEPGPYKMRAELETGVGSLEIAEQILGQLGYQPLFRYEKYRTEFHQGNQAPGVVTLDETPIGNFLELEGTGEWIDATASLLGFRPKDYVLESYGNLYLADCARRGVEPKHMVFAS